MKLPSDIGHSLKSNAAPVEQAGNDSVCRAAFTTGDAAGTRRFRPPVFAGITEERPGHYLWAETITSANARLVDFQAALPLAQIWGSGEVASADGMRFVTPVRTINAGPNRKYFGHNRGITWYNFISDQYSGFHGIVILGTLRDLIFVLEGLLEQETGLNPTEIMTDTAGASDLVFGLFWLLGYQFSPRLADAGASVFWRMDNDADYGVLNDIARGQSDPQKIVLAYFHERRSLNNFHQDRVITFEQIAE